MSRGNKTYLTLLGDHVQVLASYDEELQMRRDIIVFITLSTLTLACTHKSTREPQSDDQLIVKIESYRKQCLQIKKYNVQSRYPVDCHYNYHHFNSKHRQYYSKTKAREKLKIAGFNVWHPGTSKTFFKDYQLVAEMMNEWDLVGATELLPVVGDDLEANERLIEFMTNGRQLIAQKKKQIESASGKRKEKYEDDLKKLTSDLRVAPNYYRAPGYLHLLEELRKLDPSWSLLLAPRGEAAKETDVQELSGYFYRSSKVHPQVNPYCEKYRVIGKATPYGCIPNMGSHFLGKDKREVFSRRPFMASFKSYQFDFNLILSHIVFISPPDDSEMKKIMNLAFDVDHYDQLGTGINSANYARFAETKVILDFIQKLEREFPEQDHIFIGDFNLEASNQFWPEMLSSFPDKKVLVEAPTSVSELRFVAGEPSHGLASNYDHFIVSQRATTECQSSGKFDAQAYNFYHHGVGRKVQDQFIVRGTAEKQPYPQKSNYNQVRNHFISQMTKKLDDQKIITRNKFVQDNKEKSKRKKDIDKRIIKSQFNDKTYYKIYKELLSDHIPIHMSCITTNRDDD